MIVAIYTRNSTHCPVCRASVSKDAPSCSACGLQIRCGFFGLGSRDQPPIAYVNPRCLSVPPPPTEPTVALHFSLARGTWIPYVVAWDPATGEFRRVEGPRGFAGYRATDETSRFLAVSYLSPQP